MLVDNAAGVFVLTLLKRFDKNLIADSHHRHGIVAHKLTDGIGGVVGADHSVGLVVVEFIVNETDIKLRMLSDNTSESLRNRCVLENIFECASLGTQHKRRGHQNNNSSFHGQSTFIVLPSRVISICSKLLSLATTSSSGSAGFHLK